MIQGGGMTEAGIPKPTKSPITNEADNGLSNVRGSIAMARLKAPHSATSQFYINFADNLYLDHRSKLRDEEYGYAVFGKVADDPSMAVVDRIAAAPRRGQAPVKPVRINKVAILNE
jgi:cyclophilin family peptidyl-prolyl cis-trans isomerase